MPGVIMSVIGRPLSPPFHQMRGANHPAAARSLLFPALLTNCGHTRCLSPAGTKGNRLCFSAPG
jgi:hypothetical protein